jgi:nitrile hydratase
VAFDPSAKGRPHPYRREEGTPPRFQIGDAVITVNFQPHGHTRLPRYARGKRGVINRVQGTFVFGDSNGSGLGEQPQPVYSVRIEAGELWGDNPDFRRGAVYLDLWESHLRPA